MTARELYERLTVWSPIEGTNRSDGLVFGDGERAVRTVAVTLIKVAAIAAVMLLLKWLIGRVNKNK